MSAPLTPTTFIGPGLAGLNKQQSGSILGPEWAIEARNGIFDDANRLASREGWLAVTGTPLGGNPNIEQIFEHKGSANNQVVSAANNNLYSGTTTLSSILGAIVPTANNWKFVQFGDYVYGLQTGHPLIRWNGVGNFAAVTASSGTVPTGNELLSAFGRLWGVNADRVTIQYSGLLDGAAWAAGGAGSIDLTSVWPTADEIVALAAFNAYLVIFGKRNIILMGDGSGSSLGINPANIYVVDMVPGIGCIARDSVQNIDGDDLIFLSSSGVFSLRRVVEERSNPLRDVSANVRDYLITKVNAATMSQIRSVYVPKKGLYLLLLPTANSIFAFSTKLLLPDGTWRVTEWDNFFPRSLACLEDGSTLYSGSVGRIFQYSGQQDNGTAFRYVYRSGWMNMGDEVANRIKILKRLASIIFVSGSTSLVFKWAYDFSSNMTSLIRNTAFSSTGGEWGLGEWGLAEFGGSLGLREFEIPTSGSGQFIQVGLEAEISSDFIALQQMQLFAKTGRLA